MITLEQFKACMPFASAKNITLFLDPLNKTMDKYQINTPRRAAAFLAQLAHESGSLQYVKELASGAAYDTGKLAAALGNTPEADGDGEKYKGRGLIQITGHTNYQKLSEALSQDFINNPTLLEQPMNAALSAGWFWNSRALNTFADRDDFLTITKKINGGTNGWADRVQHWNRCMKALGVTPLNAQKI